jgi:hypothetical protein
MRFGERRKALSSTGSGRSSFSGGRKSRRTSGAFVGLLALLAATGCAGEGAVLLTIEALDSDGLMQIPDEVSRLDVTIGSDAEPSLWTRSYELAAPQQFPLTLGLDPGEKTATWVDVGAATA